MDADRLADLRHWLSELQSGDALFQVEDVRALLAERDALTPPVGRMTVREGGMPLDGADAQALEHALTITERERDAARAERDEARSEHRQMVLRVEADRKEDHARQDRIREVLLEVSRLSPAALGSYALWARLQLATGGSDAA